MGFPLLTYYNASKYALEAITDSLRYEVGPFGIRVHSVLPGLFGTRFVSKGLVANPATVSPASPYAALAAKLVPVVAKKINEGPDPVPVAEAVLRVIEDAGSPIRTPVGVEAETFVPMAKQLIGRGVRGEGEGDLRTQRIRSRHGEIFAARFPRKGGLREAGSSPEEMVQERAQAEPAENQCGKRRKQQDLQDEGGRSPLEQKQHADGQGEGSRHPLGEPAGERSGLQADGSRPVGQGPVIDGVERVQAGEERAPPKDPGQDQEDRGRLEDDGRKEDRPDRPRLKHERGEPDGTTLLRRRIQSLLEDEIPPGIRIFRSTCHDLSRDRPSPGRTPRLVGSSVGPY